MHEGMPEPKEQPESEKTKSSPETPPYAKEKVLRFFQVFRARPDVPKYTYEEQDKIGELMEIANKRYQEEKTAEAEKKLEELTIKFKEGKADKKHVAALWPPLAAAQLFLEASDDAKKIPRPEWNRLVEKVNNLLKGLEEAQEKEYMSDELVTESLRFMRDLEGYLK